MLVSLGLIILGGYVLSLVARKLHLPPLVGMLVGGILMGPCVLNVLDGSIYTISADIRKMALIVILLKAGLSLDLNDLKKVGRPAVCLSFLPATFELLGCTLLAPMFFGISYSEGALLGSILAAVSPAVVVPKMTELMDKKKGTDRAIPQMILAGASLDDIYVMVLFSAFLKIVLTGDFNAMSLLDVPVSIITGIAGGYAVGKVLSKLINDLPTLTQFIVVTGCAFLVSGLESLLPFGFSGLLAVMMMGNQLRETELKDVYNKVWGMAQIFLFVLVGAAVDLSVVGSTGLTAVVFIICCLGVRTIGVILSLAGTSFTFKEKLFIVVAYIPKATVQAAIGGIPLMSGVASGNLMLSVAVVSILFCAPIGAIGMDWLEDRCLQ